MFKLRTSVGVAAAVVCLQAASGGVITVGVAGIDNAAWQWQVPMLLPGDIWTDSFHQFDNGSYVHGTLEAGVRANGRFAWFTITNFVMGSEGHATQLTFNCTANLDFLTSFNGWGNPIQIFDADHAINSPNARIDWSKGARWNNVALPPLSGHFAPNDLTSSLYGVSGAFNYFTSPIHLFSDTTILLRTGALNDAVELPESAHDEIEIPGPATLAVLGGLLMLAKRRRA